MCAHGLVVWVRFWWQWKSRTSRSSSLGIGGAGWGREEMGEQMVEVREQVGFAWLTGALRCHGKVSEVVEARSGKGVARIEGRRSGRVIV